MWESEEFDLPSAAIYLVGAALFVLLGVLALLLRLSLVDTVIFFSIAVPFLVILLYGWYVTREGPE